MARLVVGIDGSEHSAPVLAWALREAAVREADVTVVTVLAPVPNAVGLYYPENRGCSPEELDRAESVIAALVTDIKNQDPSLLSVRVKPRAIVGDAAHELLAVAQDADLVVVGSHGAGAISRFVLGSVCSSVVHHAVCPVVVVPSVHRTAHAPVAARAVAGPGRQR